MSTSATAVESEHDTGSDQPIDVTRFTDLTQHEISALRTRFNLADAHTHQGQSPSQDTIVSDLPRLWYEAEAQQQAHFEHRFTSAFFQLHGQSTAAAKGRSLLSYAASISTLIAGMYLRQRGMTVTLIEPCFDNLADALRNLRVPLHPIPENTLADAEHIYENLTRHVHTDALFLVDPNNPTGFTIMRDGRRAFEEVIRFCVDHRKVLLIDFCFASFALAEGGKRFDVYQMLEESGVTYMTIEDTGKTWPIQDAKCAILTASDDLWEDVYRIHTSVLLNVSPFVLNLVTRYIEDSIRDDFASVRDVIVRNRATAVQALDGSVLVHQDPVADVSVAWFRIDSDAVTATDLQAALTRDEIYVLPGTYFYWSQPARGERYIRLALARRPEMFAEAMTRLRAALDRHVR